LTKLRRVRPREELWQREVTRNVREYRLEKYGRLGLIRRWFRRHLERS
jgi:hypothetical protein